MKRIDDRRSTVARRALAHALPLVLLFSSCSHEQEVSANSGSAAAGAATSKSIVDRPLKTYRGQLLDLAFEAASAMPLNPHVKNRGRAQYDVVRASFELDQPIRALGYGDRIVDWRRGLTLADYAVHCARHGAHAEAVDAMKRAEGMIAEADRDPNQQEWRGDRIRAGLARAAYLLGESEAAAKLEVALSPSERRELEATKATLTEAARFDQQIEAMDKVFALGDFDQARAAMDACAALFDRYFADAERRAKAEARLRSGYPKLPLMARLELLIGAGHIALTHEDRAKALELADAARTVMQGGTWLPELRIPLSMRITALEAEAGDRDRGITDIEAALSLFESEQVRIVDIRKAGVLRAVAEACIASGDVNRAAEIYGRAVDAGTLNPNSRPRADDLVATCCSMATCGFEPDPTLLLRMTTICGQLGDPW